MKNFNNIIIDTIKILNKGGVILYPTDTIWGIGCDATNKQAISKIYSIKNRGRDNPLILLMNKNMLSQYVENIPDAAQDIINNSSSPTTIIYNTPKNLPTELIYKNTIGIRVVKNHYLNHLLAFFDKPITSTSANISGHHSPNSFEDISEDLKNRVDYIVPKTVNNTTTNNASRIIKVTNNNVMKIIRK